MFTAIFVVLVAFAILVLMQRLSRRRDGGDVWPYAAKRLMSAPEQVLYGRLVKALPSQLVFSQIAASRILRVTATGKDWRTWMNRIDRLSIDFIVCNPDSSVVAAIELDDSSHQRNDRRASDEKKDRALFAAGIRVIRWHVKSLPDEGAIRVAVNPPITGVGVKPTSTLRITPTVGEAIAKVHGDRPK